MAVDVDASSIKKGAKTVANKYLLNQFFSHSHISGILRVVISLLPQIVQLL